MKDITYILPLDKFDATVENYMEIALNSINEMDGCDNLELIIVGPSTVVSKAEIVYNSLNKQNVKVKLVQNNDNTDIATQINKAVDECKTDYFSVIEFDDEYYSHWFNTVREYINSYDCSVYMPLTEYVDTDRNFKSFANEIALSNSFSNEQGVIDLESLETFMDYSVSGSVIKKEDFISVGMLKPSMGIAMWYEFLLRLARNEKIIFVIPFVGYKHMINRDGSYLKEENGRLSPEEGEWLINTARQESHYAEDRNRTYEKEKQ